MKMGLSAASLKCDFYKRIKPADSLRPEIRSGVKGEAVHAFYMAFVFGEKLRAAAIGIRLYRRNLPPGPARLAKLQAHQDRRSRRAACCVQHMSGNSF